jgi:hypothetical protein
LLVASFIVATCFRSLAFKAGVLRISSAAPTQFSSFGPLNLSASYSFSYFSRDLWSKVRSRPPFLEAESEEASKEEASTSTNSSTYSSAYSSV